MIFPKCCGSEKDVAPGRDVEIIEIERAKGSCGLCENYATSQQSKPVAVACCEGACLRGEIARRVANHLCYALASERTARICLGGAFTKDTGQRNLVRQAPRLLVLEGCPVNCASRMLNGVIPGLKSEVISVDRLCDFDKNLFALNEMDSAEIDALANAVAQQLAARL